MIKNPSIIGLLAGFTSILLWYILNFANPYNNSMDLDPMINTFFTLLLPACLAILSSLKSKPIFMLIAFFWSLPISLYMILTPGIFALFGITSFAYLVSYFFTRIYNKRHQAEQQK